MLEATPVIARDELVKVSPLAFVTVNGGLHVVVQRDSAGRTTGFTVSQGMQSLQATRAP